MNRFNVKVPAAGQKVRVNATGCAVIIEDMPIYQKPEDVPLMRLPQTAEMPMYPRSSYSNQGEVFNFIDIYGTGASEGNIIWLVTTDNPIPDDLNINFQDSYKPEESEDLVIISAANLDLSSGALGQTLGFYGIGLPGTNLYGVKSISAQVYTASPAVSNGYTDIQVTLSIQQIKGEFIQLYNDAFIIENAAEKMVQVVFTADETGAAEDVDGIDFVRFRPLPINYIAPFDVAPAPSYNIAFRPYNGDVNPDATGFWFDNGTTIICEKTDKQGIIVV